jgi:two-component system chemotaxis response regulator CheB
MTDIRVLVTDDSAVIRRLVADVINAERGLQVVGTAENGRRALELVAELRPDVVTLDIEMPVMDGLEAAAALHCRDAALPIIMFSTLTVAGATATLEALARGASDFVSKPSGPGGLAAAQAHVRADLVPKIRALGAKRVAPHATTATPVAAPPPRPPSASRPDDRPRRIDAIVVGVSTGGPKALESVVPTLPGDLAVPVLVVQHMPPTFTALLAERLDRMSAVRVTEATHGERVAPGHVFIAPGDHHLELRRQGVELQLALHDEPPENSCRPAADVLFRSAAAALGAGVLGVVLTGMGEDGTSGARAVHDAGGSVVAQDAATSVVWGMPGSVVRAGLADQVVPLSDVAGEITRRAAAGRVLRTAR